MIVSGQKDRRDYSQGNEGMAMNPEVDPRAPRFGQAVTAILALVGVAVGQPAVIFLLTLVLVIPVVSRWRIDPYGFLWRHGLGRFLGQPAKTESAIPHRFARLIGATCTVLASILLVGFLVTGIEIVALAGYGVALLVGLLAALSAVTGLCLGCKMYKQVGLFRDLGLLASPAESSR